MSLDLAVSRMVAHAALLEAALHSQETWYIGIGEVWREAVCEAHEHGVTFRACFPPMTSQIEAPCLFEGMKLRGVMSLRVPEGEFCVAWHVSLSETVPA